MCTHFRSYLSGAQFTLRTDHRSLRWLQKFRNSDGMLARWYMLFGQFSVTFEYRPGAQHNVSLANASRLIVRYHHRKRTPGTPDRRRRCWTNLLPLQLCVIRWMQTCCPNCPEKRGWRPPISTKSLLISRQPSQSQTYAAFIWFWES